MSSEEAMRAAIRMSEAAESMKQSANRIEDAVQKLAHMFEPGYGGTAMQLVELLESVNPDNLKAPK